MPSPSLRFRIDRIAGSADFQVELFVGGNPAANARFTDAELQAWPAGDIQTRMLNRPDVPTLIEIGGFLHSLLVRGDIAAALADTRFDAVAVDAIPDVLRMLPWETLHDGRNFLAATNRALPTWRRLAGHQPHPGEPLPLRVLMVVGDRDDGDSNWNDEVRAIRRIFRGHAHKIDWELLVRPSRDRLAELCRTFRPHVFHFIGHGKMTPGQHSEPVLVIAGANPGDEDEISVATLEALLVSPVWNVKVALFNACRSAQASSQQAVYDFGRSFVEMLGGCCAVTMQGDIEVTAAARFSAELYAKLVSGKCIDVAVAEARRTLQQSAPDRPDWAFPVLQTGCDQTIAVPMKFRAPAKAVSSIEMDFGELRQFVDRQQERRALWSEVAYGETAHHLLIVHGEQKSGKTWLLEWLVRNWALLGESVRYLRFDGRSHDYDSVLEAIRQGSAAAWGNNQPFPAAAFTDYSDALADIRAGQPRIDNYIPDLFEKFVAALDTVARNPLLLVLDSFVSRPPTTPGGIVDSGFNYIVQHLVKRIADGDLPNVRLLLATGKAEVERAPLSSLVAFSSARAVGRLPLDEFTKWAHERFGDVIHPTFRQAMEAIIDAHKGNLSPQLGWTMGELEIISGYLAALPRSEP